MCIWKAPRTIPGQWLSGLTIVGLIISPFGCQTIDIVTGGDGQNAFGVLVNTDESSDVLGGIRLDSGESVFLYGSRTAEGNIADITAATFTDASGGVNSLTLESGRPKQAMSADGSSLEVFYDEVTPERLAGRVEIFIASSGETRTVEFDVDLQLAATELARIVEEYTGISISDEPPPEEAAEQMRPLSPLDAVAGKPDVDRQQTVFFAVFFPPVFALLGYTMVLVLTQVMRATILALTVITRAVIVAVFTPFIVMGEILRGSLSRPLVIIDFDLVANVTVIPPRPRF